MRVGRKRGLCFALVALLLSAPTGWAGQGDTSTHRKGAPALEEPSPPRDVGGPEGNENHQLRGRPKAVSPPSAPADPGPEDDGEEEEDFGC